MYSHFSVDSGQFDWLLSGHMGVSRAALVECGAVRVHLQTPCLLFANLPAGNRYQKTGTLAKLLLSESFLTASLWETPDSVCL